MKQTSCHQKTQGGGERWELYCKIAVKPQQKQSKVDSLSEEKQRKITHEQRESG